MTITLALTPETEQKLLARAEARGVSLTEFVQELVAREAAGVANPARRRTGEDLITVCALVHGLADDLDITRDRSPGRSVDLS